jgi:hypothetical protein
MCHKSNFYLKPDVVKEIISPNGEDTSLENFCFLLMIVLLVGLKVAGCGALWPRSLSSTFVYYYHQEIFKFDLAGIEI